MSLSGNLRALSLPELLQIVALSKKTGSLEICSDLGVAWLGLRDGGIVRVARDSERLAPETIRDKIGADALDPEKLEAALWEAAVHAVLEIFDWQEGEFVFQPSDGEGTSWRGPAGVTLSTPLAPEFLALEGARLEDEANSSRPPANAAPVEPEMDWSDLNDNDVEDAPTKLFVEPTSPEPAPAPIAEPKPKPPEVVICVDADLATLERIKQKFGPACGRFHIFQGSGDALTRLKQYMVNGTLPVLVLASSVEDPLDAPRGLGWRRFVARVRSLAPNIRLVLMREPGGDDDVAGIHNVAKPDPHTATSADIDEFLSSLGRILGIDA